MEDKIKILLLEDRKEVYIGLIYALGEEGFEIEHASTINFAKELITKNEYDLFLLDVMLPDGSGFDLCREIKSKTDTPVIFLTGRTEEINVVLGLDIGADDYVTKPFRIKELVSRIKSVLRRYKRNKEEKNIIKCSNIKVDLCKAKVYVDYRELDITALEYKIMVLLTENKNKLVTRQKLLERIWDIDEKFVNDNTLTVYIKRLRDKIGSCKTVTLKTLRGLGYMLEEKC